MIKYLRLKLLNIYFKLQYKIDIIIKEINNYI